MTPNVVCNLCLSVSFSEFIPENVPFLIRPLLKVILESGDQREISTGWVQSRQDPNFPYSNNRSRRMTSPIWKQNKDRGLKVPHIRDYIMIYGELDSVDLRKNRAPGIWGRKFKQGRLSASSIPLSASTRGPPVCRPGYKQMSIIRSTFHVWSPDLYYLDRH